MEQKERVFVETLKAVEAITSELSAIHECLLEILESEGGQRDNLFGLARIYEARYWIMNQVSLDGINSPIASGRCSHSSNLY